MSVIEVRNITGAIPCCDINAIVVATTGVRNFGSGGKYINFDLMDGDSTIKLTLFGENFVTMGENLEVGKHYRFKNVRAGQVKASFEHLCKHEHKMELYAGHQFAIEEVRPDDLSSSERASLSMKSNVHGSNSKYECPKASCSRQMTKIKSGDFECLDCGENFKTFKYRDHDEPKIDDASENNLTPKREKASTSGKSSTPKREKVSTSIEIVDSDEEKTPKRRCLRGRKKNA